MVFPFLGLGVHAVASVPRPQCEIKYAERRKSGSPGEGGLAEVGRARWSGRERGVPDVKDPAPMRFSVSSFVLGVSGWEVWRAKPSKELRFPPTRGGNAATGGRK